MKYPSKATLKKYGLSRKEWKALYTNQGGNCACGRPLGDGRTVIDHLHVTGWKKMKPDMRKQFVRGLCHWRCNYHFLGKGMTVDVAWSIATYLENFERRKPR